MIDGKTTLLLQKANPSQPFFLDYYPHYRRYGDQHPRQIVLNNAYWLVNNAVKHGNYSILDFKFPWPPYKLEPLWHSGMAQGLALKALIRAHEISGDKKFLNAAEMILNSFFVDVKDGGVTYKNPNYGWWYEEYAAD